jgi:DNA invertase Pin-like site-specific DNA recombinase
MAGSAFMAATAQAQADATKGAQRARIKAARLAGDAATKYRGRRPTFDVEQLHRTHELLSMGMSPSAIAAEVGIPRATVYRIKEDPAKAVALLETWGIS